ncbi:MAG TPA: malto-oligosyltrehalose trehalohydrolase [Rubrobacter sp.]|nr:malto-oligosyltrehalose trehalohydrolase [Rubrobacter sp.]
MRRRHEMPLGAEVLEDGETRFNLWAPAAEDVDLVLEGDGIPMSRQEDGTFSLTTRAGAGTRYRFRIDGGEEVPDPASRSQPDGVHGASAVVDPVSYEWRDWYPGGRPWEEVVLYELHVGTFTPVGTFAGVEGRLDHLVGLGVTAIELMPLSEFPGRRNWGYDGVLPFAPESTYGTPDELKNLVQSAHDRGLMVFLDVVYNHFGPEGNYLSRYAPQFFTDRYDTPWGAAVNFDGEGSGHVREYFIHNALYWLEEYGFDGLRLDAVHAIKDSSETHFLDELAGRVREGPGHHRHVHLVLENDAKEARYLRGPYDAQWNDDLHHALHVVMTGESAGYYADYAGEPVADLGRALSGGFVHAEAPDTSLPPGVFVSFVQNHDQVGNRAFGERIGKLASPEAVRAAAEIYLLAPQTPMLFMGEEWNADSPFPFFCDFGQDLAPLVAEGRRAEFAGFFEAEDADSIPDPGAEETFVRGKLDWASLDEQEHARHLELYRGLLALRRAEILPRLGGSPGGESGYEAVGERGLRVWWRLGDDSCLTLLANLGPEPLDGVERPPGKILYAGDGVAKDGPELPGWSALWYLTG